jgi:hypothetical protein
MKNFKTKPIKVTAIKFDGTHSSGKEIQEAFPGNNIEIVYEYGRTRFKLKAFNTTDQRYLYITEDHWAVKGALGELFIYRDNLFHEMFEAEEDKKDV